MKSNQIILVTVLMLSSLINAQTEIPKLKLSPSGTEPIVVDVEGQSSEQLYKSTLNWIQEVYENPDKVLKANIENQKVRLNGYSNHAFNYTSMGMTLNYDMEYTMEIEFKDNKYRLTFTIGQFWGSGDSGGEVAWNYKAFYKKNGDARKAYNNAIPSLEETMNSLNQSLYDYVSGATHEAKSDW